MNRRVSALTAFMIIFAVIVIQYTGAYLKDMHMDIGYAEGTKCVFLTFDDGPSDGVTPRVLDVLRDEGVKATFFIVGRCAGGREKIIEREAAEGHTVGVHSFSHDYKEIYSSPAALLDDIERCNDVIERITGRRSKVYRFPGGSFTLSAALTDAVHGAGYTYVDWNASVRDAEMPNASPADLLNAAKSTSAGRNKVVLLCHDGAGKRATADALKDIIAFYRAGGYKFCTVK